MPERPSYIPANLLADVDAWRTEQPEWRDDAEPAVLAAARLQHRLAWLLRRHLKDAGVSRDEAANQLGVGRGTLWRHLEGRAPATLAHLMAWADLSGVTIEVVDPDR